MVSIKEVETAKKQLESYKKLLKWKDEEVKNCNRNIEDLKETLKS